MKTKKSIVSSNREIQLKYTKEKLFREEIKMNQKNPKAERSIIELKNNFFPKEKS